MISAGMMSPRKPVTAETRAIAPPTATTPHAQAEARAPRTTNMRFGHAAQTTTASAGINSHITPLTNAAATKNTSAMAGTGRTFGRTASVGTEAVVGNGSALDGRTGTTTGASGLSASPAVRTTTTTNN